MDRERWVFCFMKNKRVLGFNLGYGFGNTTAASENMIIYDGKAHKLEEVTFHIPTDAEGNDDYLRLWRFTSSDRRLGFAEKVRNKW